VALGLRGSSHKSRDADRGPRRSNEPSGREPRDTRCIRCAGRGARSCKSGSTAAWRPHRADYGLRRALHRHCGHYPAPCPRARCYALRAPRGVSGVCLRATWGPRAWRRVGRYMQWRDLAISARRRGLFARYVGATSVETHALGAREGVAGDRRAGERTMQERGGHRRRHRATPPPRTRTAHLAPPGLHSAPARRPGRRCWSQARRRGPWHAHRHASTPPRRRSLGRLGVGTQGRDQPQQCPREPQAGAPPIAIVGRKGEQT
jgi:hypothetical protein